VERRRPVEVAAYLRQTREQACFVCQIVDGEATLPNPVVFEDDDAIAWVNPYQLVLGYTLVAPKAHREHVTGDFTSDEYLALQAVVHRVGEAVRRAVPTERLYVLSLGSHEGNTHVHWHLVPLPPGIPYEHQQLEALRLKRGVLDLAEAELTALAERIRGELQPA
jgi:diadenosine tetraphosphate (Ap4A) HIT family hydrolase